MTPSTVDGLDDAALLRVRARTLCGAGARSEPRVPPPRCGVPGTVGRARRRRSPPAAHRPVAGRSLHAAASSARASASRSRVTASATCCGWSSRAATAHPRDWAWAARASWSSVPVCLATRTVGTRGREQLVDGVVAGPRDREVEGAEDRRQGKDAAERDDPVPVDEPRGRVAKRQLGDGDLPVGVGEDGGHGGVAGTGQVTTGGRTQHHQRSRALRVEPEAGPGLATCDRRPVRRQADRRHTQGLGPDRGSDVRRRAEVARLDDQVERGCGPQRPPVGAPLPQARGGTRRTPRRAGPRGRARWRRTGPRRRRRRPRRRPRGRGPRSARRRTPASAAGRPRTGPDRRRTRPEAPSRRGPAAAPRTSTRGRGRRPAPAEPWPPPSSGPGDPDRSRCWSRAARPAQPGHYRRRGGGGPAWLTGGTRSLL